MATSAAAGSAAAGKAAATQLQTEERDQRRTELIRTLANKSTLSWSELATYCQTTTAALDTFMSSRGFQHFWVQFVDQYIKPFQLKNPGVVLPRTAGILTLHKLIEDSLSSRHNAILDPTASRKRWGPNEYHARLIWNIAGQLSNHPNGLYFNKPLSVESTADNEKEVRRRAWEMIRRMKQDYSAKRRDTARNSVWTKKFREEQESMCCYRDDLSVMLTV